MKMTGFLVCLVLLISVAFTATAQAKTVFLLPPAMTLIHDKERARAVALIDPSIAKEYEKNGWIVIHDKAAQAVIADMQVKVGPASITDASLMAAIANKSGADRVTSAAIQLWPKTVWQGTFVRIGKGDISATEFDAASGKFINGIEGVRYHEKVQSNTAVAARGTALVGGALVASGAFIHAGQWGANHPLGLRNAGWVLAAASQFPWESRNDVQEEVVRKMARDVFGPWAAK